METNPSKMTLAQPVQQDRDELHETAVLRRDELVAEQRRSALLEERLGWPVQVLLAKRKDLSAQIDEINRQLVRLGYPKLAGFAAMEARDDE